MRRRIGRLLPYLVMAGGAVLLFLGDRELLESRWGQSRAAHELEIPVPVPQVQAQLPLGDTVGKLTIPRLDAQLYVVEGVDPADLRRGPGHMPGTALPGGNGNCVVAGHRDTHFRVLKDIRKGDDIVLETRTGLFLYRVKGTEIVFARNHRVHTTFHRRGPPHLLPVLLCGQRAQRFIVEADLAGVLNASLPPS